MSKEQYVTYLTPIFETVVDEKTNKKKKVRTQETKETRYRVDAAFVPTEANEICREFIQNYCIAKGEEAIAWLVSQYEEDIEDKNGDTMAKPILSIRKEFIKKFFPALAPKSKKIDWRAEFIAKYKK